MDKLNVLIIGVGGNVSQGILKALAYSNLDCNIIGACISPDSAGLYMCSNSYICPKAHDKEFTEWLINICAKEKIRVILSGVEEVIEILARDLEYIYEKTQAICICSSNEQIVIGNDKLLTCEWLKNNNCNYPKFARSEDVIETQNLLKEYGFPLIAKPRRGKGSQGVILIKNEIQLKELNQLENYVIEEYIGSSDSEYTVACLNDSEGNLVDVFIMRRELESGTTYKAETVEDDIIKNEVSKICNAFRPKGPLNIQLRMSNGKPVCFELNVRFSGTTPVRARLGFNDVEASIRNFVYNEDISSFFNKKKGLVLRYWNEIYVDTEVYKLLNNSGEIHNLRKHCNVENYGFIGV